MMVAALTAAFFSAMLSIFGKLATSSFFEAVLIRVFIWSGDKLAAMTTNTLDDQLMVEIKARLLPESSK